MNRKMIVHILAKMLGVEALLLILPALVGVIYQEKSTLYFLPPIILLTVIYLIGGRKKPENSTIYAKEGMVVVALAWILWSLLGRFHFSSPAIYQVIWMHSLKQCPDLQQLVRLSCRMLKSFHSACTSGGVLHIGSVVWECWYLLWY